nr:hypothetical protein [uncultured Methanolobus sp.]
MTTSNLWGTLPPEDGYYHVFENGKLWGKWTFGHAEDIERWKEEYPERKLIKQEGEQVHKILLKVHDEEEKEYKNMGYWNITETNYRKLYEKITFLGGGSGPMGQHGITIYKYNFGTFKKYAKKAGQQTLF